MLQCVAGCCSVLQCVSRSKSQSMWLIPTCSVQVEGHVVDTHICRLLQGVAEWGCELQCIGRRHAVDARVCSALLGIAGSCKVLQGVAGSCYVSVEGMWLIPSICTHGPLFACLLHT